MSRCKLYSWLSCNQFVDAKHLHKTICMNLLLWHCSQVISSYVVCKLSTSNYMKKIVCGMVFFRCTASMTFLFYNHKLWTKTKKNIHSKIAFPFSRYKSRKVIIVNVFQNCFTKAKMCSVIQQQLCQIFLLFLYVIFLQCVRVEHLQRLSLPSSLSIFSDFLKPNQKTCTIYICIYNEF